MADEWSKPVKEPTYTIDYPCSVCGHVTRVTGFRPVIVDDKVVIPLHCSECQASGAYTMHRHDLIGQPDYVPPGEREAKFAATMAALKAKRDEAELRRMAAEASDRLGWVWEVANLGPAIGWVAQATVGDVLKFRWLDSGGGPISTKPSTFGHSPDELVAAHHGVALLEDALREAGR